MLESIAGALASGGWGPVIGGITGFAGGIVNKWMAYKVKKLEIKDNESARAHNKEMASLNNSHMLALAEKEIDGRANQASLEGEIDIAKIDLNNLGLSIGADERTYSDETAQQKSVVVMYAMAFVDWVRGMVRPVLTVGLVWGTWEIYSEMAGFLETVNAGGLPVNVVIQLVIITVVAILTLTATAVGYWFGSRPTVFKVPEVLRIK